MVKMNLLKKDQSEMLEQCDEAEIYSKANIASLKWPKTEAAQKVKNFFLPLIREESNIFFKNIAATFIIIKIGDTVIPSSINDEVGENSYVCSPYSYFGKYPLDCLKNSPKKFLKFAATRLYQGFSHILKRTGIDKSIIINNWLFATNLMPTLSMSTIEKLCQKLSQVYPNHSLVVRCIDPLTSFETFQNLQKLNFKMIASKQIFIAYPDKVIKSRIFKSDFKLLQNSNLDIEHIAKFTDMELARVLDLYTEVYVGKYSNLNPKYTTRFLRHLQDSKFMNFIVLRQNQKIVGVVGYYSLHGMMNCPIFGYDMSIPQSHGLYRQLSTVLMLEAQKQGLIFHQSAGASMYKTIRKATALIEYQAVYSQNLSLPKKLTWQMLSSLSNNFGIPIMKKY